MIDKITKAFTYAGKVNYISRRRFLSYLQKCEKTRKLATSYWTQYAREWGVGGGMRLAKDYRAMGNFAIPITENMKLINLQSSAYFFFLRSRLTIHINSQVAREQALHLGESREVTRERHAKDDASFAAPSPVLSQLVSLATWNGDLARRLIYGASIKLLSLRVWTRTSGCKG